MTNEEKIRLAKQMYDCRKLVKLLNEKGWKNDLANFKSVIRHKMKADAIDEVTAAIRLSKEAGEDSFKIPMFFMAAAVDMIEPE